MKPGDFVTDKGGVEPLAIGVVLRVGGRLDAKGAKQVTVLWGDNGMNGPIEWDWDCDLLVTESIPAFLFFKNGNPMF